MNYIFEIRTVKANAMKGSILSLILLYIAFACSQRTDNQQAVTETKTLPRIAITGLAIESSTFSPARTHEEAFHAKTGDEIFSLYPFLSPDSANRKRANWIPTLIGRSLPGGMVTLEAYESLVGKVLELLEKGGPYDGLFFDIHGAMSVEGLDDPEGDLIVRVRMVVGT